MGGGGGGGGGGDYCFHERWAPFSLHVPLVPSNVKTDQLVMNNKPSFFSQFHLQER